MTLKEKSEISVSEELLYYVWNLKRFDLSNLQTSRGREIQIISGGYRNQDSGPDFLHAKIRIGKELWAGHVEMHVRSSDWLRHNHQSDKAFENVILHVVYDHDKSIDLPNGEELACLELKDRIGRDVLVGYEQLMQSSTWIPCENNIRPISAPARQAWYERILVERLIAKTSRIDAVLEATENDWEEAFYRALFRNFGFRVNADAFEALSISLPRIILMKHKDKLKQIEAILFGQAGLLGERFADDYPEALRKEYEFLQKKYKLTPISSQQFRFMRMRPANFPTIRLAQFAVLTYRTDHLFSKMLAAQSIKEIINMFQTEVSGYWNTHYTFDHISEKKSKKLGKSSIELLIINTIVPFIFHYGRLHHYEDFQERALRFLADLRAESNQVIKKYSELDFAATSAFDSQALLQLKSEYCDKKKCIECAIGISILKA